MATLLMHFIVILWIFPRSLFRYTWQTELPVLPTPSWVLRGGGTNTFMCNVFLVCFIVFIFYLFSLVHSDIVIAVFWRPSFRVIVSALWCLLVLFHSCSYSSLYFIMQLFEWDQISWTELNWCVNCTGSAASLWHHRPTLVRNAALLARANPTGALYSIRLQIAGLFLVCSSTQKCSSKEICAVLLSKMCSCQMDNISKNSVNF